MPIPASLAGKRCLDAAACEGFWSFEMARRGADEVVSVDLPDTAEQDWQGRVDEDERELGTGHGQRALLPDPRRAGPGARSSAGT